MTPTSWIAVAAIVISLLTFLATQRGNQRHDRRQDQADYVKENERLKEVNANLTDENIDLMRRVVREQTSGLHLLDDKLDQVAVRFQKRLEDMLTTALAKTVRRRDDNGGN